MARIDSALYQAGVTSSLDDARSLIRSRRVMICERSRKAYAPSCRHVSHPHQNLRGRAWALVGDTVIRFDQARGRFMAMHEYAWNSPMGGAKRRKR